MNTHVRPPAESLDSFSINLLTQEQARQTALRSLARLRKEASDQIEQLLIFLDMIDGYTMSEREPSLTGYSMGMDDREGDDCDQEPSLGWSTTGHCGSIHGFVDAELDTSDDEPSLCGIRADDGPSDGDREDDRSDYEPSEDAEPVDYAGHHATVAKARKRYRRERSNGLMTLDGRDATPSVIASLPSLVMS